MICPLCRHLRSPMNPHPTPDHACGVIKEDDSVCPCPYREGEPLRAKDLGALLLLLGGKPDDEEEFFTWRPPLDNFWPPPQMQMPRTEWYRFCRCGPPAIIQPGSNCALCNLPFL